MWGTLSDLVKYLRTDRLWKDLALLLLLSDLEFRLLLSSADNREGPILDIFLHSPVIKFASNQSFGIVHCVLEQDSRLDRFSWFADKDLVIFLLRIGLKCDIRWNTVAAIFYLYHLNLAVTLVDGGTRVRRTEVNTKPELFGFCLHHVLDVFYIDLI